MSPLAPRHSDRAGEGADAGRKEMAPYPIGIA